MSAVAYQPHGSSHRATARATFSLGLDGGISEEYRAVQVNNPDLTMTFGGELRHLAERDGAAMFLVTLSGIGNSGSATVGYEFGNRHARSELHGWLAFSSWMENGYNSEETQGVSTGYVSRAEKVLSHLYLLTAKERKQQALEVAFEFIESEFAADNAVSVDEVLRKLTINRIPVPLLVGILRATSRAQSILPSWSRLLHAAQTYIDAAQIDSKRALRGLLQRPR